MHQLVFTFIGGFISGIFIGQSYNVPNVGKLAIRAMNKMKELEKEEKKDDK